MSFPGPSTGVGEPPPPSRVEPRIEVIDHVADPGTLVLVRDPGEDDAAHAPRARLYAGLFGRVVAPGADLADPA